MTGRDLTLDDVVAVARTARQALIADAAKSRILASEAIVKEAVENSRVIYGITTGFGKFANVVIPEHQVRELQRNLLRSHAVGVGNSAPKDATRAMLLLRVNALASGASGIALPTVLLMLDMLNRNILPVVPEKGSVGASGDLAPLAHLALPLIGEGEALVNDVRMGGGEALQSSGLQPVDLGPKEGLALINGTQFMTAIGALVLYDAARLATTFDIAGAMSLEAVRGTNTAFDQRIQELRPHPGQRDSAWNLRCLTESSPLMRSHKHDSHKVQDPYSLRCMPQVHGASRDALRYATQVVEIEMNSATDNPLIFPESGDVLSGGNFHGQPVGIAMDTTAIGVAELANISERRVEAMLDPSFSELPPFLTRHAGVDSGYMVSQYTAAALVSENKILCHPATVDSIPTSANQEDHVSMGATAARKAREVTENAQIVAAIELLCACEGLDYRRPLESSPALEAVHTLVRSRVEHLNEDRVMSPDILAVVDLIKSGAVIQAAEMACGKLR